MAGYQETIDDNYDISVIFFGPITSPKVSINDKTKLIIKRQIFISLILSTKILWWKYFDGKINRCGGEWLFKVRGPMEPTVKILINLKTLNVSN